MLEITKMTIEDYDQIKDILQEKFDDFWTTSSLKQVLENSNNQFFVAKQNDIIIGFAGVLNNIDYVEILNIVVHKEYRNQGYGKELLNAIIDYAKEQGKSIVLEVNEHNEYAIELYKNAGFTQNGLRKKYYNNTDDAILMILNLK